MLNPFPKGKTAFMVIHGIGEQMPLETLDSYSRGIIAELEARKASFSLEHRIAERGQGDATWTESFVRLTSPAGDILDIHECYWAYLTEEKASLGGIVNWLALTAFGTVRYYRENEALQAQYEARKGYRSLFRFPIHRLVLFALVWYPLLWLGSRFIPKFARTLLGKLARPAATWIVVGYIADIAIYTTTDEKSKFCAIRNKILSASQSLLESLLAEGQYDRVFVAGHSLGSVIAYDTLNRLNIKASLHSATASLLGRLAGLVTFGSPLDKIAFFFREHAKPGEDVRRRILSALHSFRAKPLDLTVPTLTMASQVVPHLDGIPWLNFFDPRDPVSGHLDFYADVDNRRLDLGARWGVAHTAYWEDAEFYRSTFETLFGQQATAIPVTATA